MTEPSVHIIGVILACIGTLCAVVTLVRKMKREAIEAQQAIVEELRTELRDVRSELREVKYDLERCEEARDEGKQRYAEVWQELQKLRALYIKVVTEPHE